MKTTQRKMLRKIVACKRKQIIKTDSDLSSHTTSSVSVKTDEQPELENWIDYIVRSTRMAESLSGRFHVRDWVTEHFRCKFRLAGHIARRTDDRWSARALVFLPEGGSRGQGRPVNRWDNCINDFFWSAHAMGNGQWKELAVDRRSWSNLEKVFCEFHMPSQ